LANGPTSTGMPYRVIARDSYSLLDPKAVSRPFSLPLILPAYKDIWTTDLPVQDPTSYIPDGDTICH